MRTSKRECIRENQIEVTAENYDWTEKYTKGIEKQIRWNRKKDQWTGTRKILFYSTESIHLDIIFVTKETDLLCFLDLKINNMNAMIKQIH